MSIGANKQSLIIAFNQEVDTLLLKRERIISVSTAAAAQPQTTEAQILEKKRFNTELSEFLNKVLSTTILDDGDKDEFIRRTEDLAFVESQPHPPLQIPDFLDQSCPEAALDFVATQLGVECRFPFERYKTSAAHTAGLDLSGYVIEHGQFDLVKFWGEGKTQEQIERLFLNREKIDPNKVYLMRTGTQQGGGHFFVVHFDQGNWFRYDSPTRPHIQIIQNGKLTDEAIGQFVVAHGKWVSETDDLDAYLISYFEVDKPLLESLIDAVIKHRTS